jgi:uncharacterized protein (DUF305 family)
MSTNRTALPALAATLFLFACCGGGAVPYDLQFIDAMTLHHQGAIAMAGPAESLALHPELREFARKVVADQSREVQAMAELRARRYKGKAQAPGVMQMPGMDNSMSAADPGHLSSLSGNAFDLMWVEMMVEHHEGAVVMSTEAMGRAQHPEVKELARAIIDAQQAEIRMMRGWLAEWAAPK